jgi:hypothetical protein
VLYCFHDQTKIVRRDAAELFEKWRELMTTYRDVNAVWPDPIPVPTSRDAITGAKRLIRHAHRLAVKDGAVPKYSRLRRFTFKLTSGNRYTEVRRTVWYINPNQGGHWGWHQIVHGVSHWAQRHYWPKAGGHGALHAWLEKELADYAIKNFLDGQLTKLTRDTIPVDKIAVRAARVSARIKEWEAKRRRADNAIRKLRRTERYYGRRSRHPGVPAAATIDAGGAEEARA